MSDTSGPIKINLEQVLHDRLGRKSFFVPAFLRRKIERLIRQDDLNALLENNYPKRGSDFCRGVLADLGVEVRIKGVDNLPPRESGRVIFVCNHPLGGLDGMALIAWLSEVYGVELQVVVNDLLMVVEPLSTCFVPVNKHGSQSRQTARCIDDVMGGDLPVLMFPAGLVSRLGDDGVVSDLSWNKMFLRKARDFKRDVVPLYFEGHNTPRFYKMARRRVKLGLKFNFEMALLPGEVFAAAGSRYTITCGKALPWESLAAPSAVEAERIKQIVYNLPS